MEKENRKPDIETESLKIEILKDEEKEEYIKQKDMDLKVKIGDDEIFLMDFEKVIGNNDKVIFAFKIKDKEKRVLYYDFKIPNEEKAVKEIMERFGKASKIFGISIENVEDVMGKMYADKGLMKMVDDKAKDKEKKNERTKNS